MSCTVRCDRCLTVIGDGEEWLARSFKGPVEQDPGVTRPSLGRYVVQVACSFHHQDGRVFAVDLCVRCIGELARDG